MRVNTKQLSAALASIGRIIKPTRSRLPILSCVKLESANGELVITGTSLDEYQTEIVACNGDLEPIAVNLGHLMWSIGNSEEVTLNVEKQRLEIEETGSSLAISPVVEFDGAISGFLTPNSKDGLVKIGVSVEDVFELVKSVAWAASSDVSRAALTRTHIVGSAKNLKAEATNGYVLAWNERAVISADFEMCVENDFASNLCEALSRKGADLSQNSGKISVAHESGAYMCKKSELLYPNTKNALPHQPFIKIGEIDWQRFRAAAAGRDHQDDAHESPADCQALSGSDTSQQSRWLCGSELKRGGAAGAVLKSWMQGWCVTCRGCGTGLADIWSDAGRAGPTGS